METSYIVFAGIVLGGILGLPLVLKGIHRLVKDYFKFQEHKEEKIQNQKIEETKNDLKKITNSGNLSELIDAANKLGEENKKK